MKRFSFGVGFVVALMSVVPRAQSLDSIIADAKFGGPPPHRAPHAACKPGSFDTSKAAEAFRETVRKRFGAALQEVDVVDCIAVVFWFIDGSDPRAPQSARTAIFDILHAFDTSGVNVSRLKVAAIRQGRDRPVQVEYTRKTLDRINWMGFEAENVYEITDAAQMAPGFKLLIGQ